MSDELDPNLLCVFARARESLPGTEFQAKILAELRRSRGWAGPASAFRFFARTALAGIAAGVRAPLKVHYAAGGMRIRPFVRM